jgi:phosphoglycerate dehydrogenase-like enzyme
MENVTITAHAGFRTLEASMTLLRRAIDIVSAIIEETPPSPAAARVQVS